jgi:hypothetical protein
MLNDKDILYICFQNMGSMNSITTLWTTSKKTFEEKSLSQILSFAGDGKLKDGNITSIEFRELLEKVPLLLLQRFADNCLTDKFDDSGFALQDIINEIGTRLGFSVEPGLYQGKRNAIGYDGIWTSEEGYSIVVEVKTSDAYRINLDTIADYRKKLIEQNRIDKNNSSILIVVGRQDTGDIESQIRGSKHAWDIRLLSTDSLVKLLDTKEALNDTKTIQQINELLKPQEYTRIDKLIELIFLTSRDMQLSDAEDEEIIEDNDNTAPEKRRRKSSDEKTVPVNFHAQCLSRIEKKLKVDLVKQGRISYADKNTSTGIICSISKLHKQGQHDKYWFAFHPYQQEFLKNVKNGYVAFGCGSPDNIFLIPFDVFAPLIPSLWITEKEGRMYWHVVIHERNGKYLLAQPILGKGEMMDITKHKI